MAGEPAGQGHEEAFRIELREEETGGVFEVFADGRDAPAGEMTFSKTGDHLWIIDHTGVRPPLQGTGAAAALVRRGVEEARKRGIRIYPLCPYARSQFRRHPEYGDVLK